MENLFKEYNPNEEIIEYLKKQEVCDEGEAQYLDIEKELEVKGILNCIVDRIEDRARRKQEHEENIKTHNQYPLFDLSTIIKDAFIDDDYYNQILFRETLIVSKVNEDNTLTTVGGLSLDIQSAKGAQPLVRKFKEESFTQCLEIPEEKTFWGDRSLKKDDLEEDEEEETQELVDHLKKKYHRDFTKFLVHMHSQLDVDGKNGGSKVTAWVDRNLHTLEEKRTEFIMEENLREKSLYVALSKGKYYVKARCRPQNLRSKMFYSLQKTMHFIGEGANFILMRFLAIFRYTGAFEMSTMYINGDMCRNIYICNGPEGGIIKDNRVDLCRIYRIVIEECGLEHRSHTLLTLNGQIIKHEWQDCDYVLHINPLLDVSNTKPSYNEGVNLKNMWQNDMQLYSMYLDEKNITSLLIRSYVLDHPELSDIVADYIQHILTLKPTEILEFTINHFRNFAPQFFPKNDYFTNTQEEEEDFFTI